MIKLPTSHDNDKLTFLSIRDRAESSPGLCCSGSRALPREVFRDFLRGKHQVASRFRAHQGSGSRAFQVLTHQEIYVVSIIFCSNHNLNKVFPTQDQKPGQKPPPLLPTLGVDQGDSQETIKHTFECGLLYRKYLSECGLLY